MTDNNTQLQNANDSKQPTKEEVAKNTIKALTKIATIVPDAWMDNSKASKLTLIKSIHTNLLGKDKLGNPRPLEDLRLFLFEAQQRNLNPFKKQIHAVYIWDSSVQSEKLIPITGIDGFATIAQRTNRFAGFSETRFEMYDDDDKEYPGLPKCAKVDIFAYNPVTGAREVVNTATAWWSEYAKYKEEWVWAKGDDGKNLIGSNGKSYKVKSGKKELNSTWATRPKGQLEKCAQALGLRRVFPEELGGLYVHQEVDRLIVDPIPEEAETKDKINKALQAKVTVDATSAPKPVNNLTDNDNAKTL